MNLSLSEEQELLRRTARGFLERHAPLRPGREPRESDAPRAARLWAEIARLGWLGLALPEPLGGSGLGPVELALVAEELGRVLAPVPFLPTSIVGLAIAELGDAAAQQRWLPPLAAGRVVATLAVAEARGEDPADVALSAAARGGGFELSGEKLFVPDAATADLFAVLARTAGEGERGLALFLVPRDASGLALGAMRSMDPLRPLHRLRLDGVRAEREQLLGGDPDAWPRVERVLDRARVLVSAAMVGGAERCLEDAVRHAQQRVQFGRPIGANQAIRHKCADMLLRVELARSITYYAAAAAAVGAPDAALAASMAKSTAGDSFRHVAAESIQIHGGIGFTWEHDCHFYFKRARSDESWLGDAAWHRERIARLLAAA